MNITYAEEALADILDAIAYLNERNPAAASSLNVARLRTALREVYSGDPHIRLRGQNEHTQPLSRPTRPREWPNALNPGGGNWWTAGGSNP